MNRLIHEKSPYLLQHANNPVDWYPWCDEAFKEAKEKDKPIFLSIGYSTCHWCHVMEKESFEDEEVAKMLNDTFICIKVDREERPDIDSIYMMYCQMMTGHGGWPLTIIMTPDKKPFFSATYIPKETVYNRIGMKDLIKRIDDLWKNDRKKLLDSSEKLYRELWKLNNEDKKGTLNKEDVFETVEEFKVVFDRLHGGFNKRPKFPIPHNLLFLMSVYAENKDEEIKEMVTKTLDHMMRGGIFDHVGFGFHRYSTDREWKLPHFEKMLYDQALLTLTYAEAYRMFKYEKYREVVEKVIEYVKRDLTSKEGAFYSAEDADSEGVEGKFYTFTLEELKNILDEEEFKIANKVYNLFEEGNFEEEATGEKTGQNILYKTQDYDEYKEKLEVIREKLYKFRENRIRPLRDEKILTDWNGLMIASLSRAGFILNNSEYINMAKRAADFILNLSKDGLKHRYKDGEYSIEPILDDYAFFTWGLIELYLSSQEVKYLKEALMLIDKMIENYLDKEKGGFFLTKETKELILRCKEIYDGAVPSGNSVASYVLYLAYRITGDTKYLDLSKGILNCFAKEIRAIKSAHSFAMLVQDLILSEPIDVVIASKDIKEVERFIEPVRSKYIKNLLVISKTKDEDERLIPHIREIQIKDEPLAYVCKNFTCGLPKNINEFLKDKLLLS
ncbi:thioredoxin domain-containing protein [Thermobrachium celere]|uniref:Thymidylate kinase n=1 Tax=Thermobrachium celere DSM 8682 TaxID=941824 RepID=R7RQX3_9CLOT|nr:thioredoxin domain-containing protein [Thermobrachium celere]CDF57693.1 Thymidylate kinase [Thermobrachium celere DSM 8682]